MNLLKHLSALLLVVVLLSSTALATDLPMDLQTDNKMIFPDLGSDPAPTEPSQIVGVLPMTMGNTCYQLLTLAPGTPLSSLQNNENRQLAINCVTDSLDQSGNPLSYWCPVEWDFCDTTDTTIPGRITVNGTLKPENGYSLADGVSPQVSTTVLVTGDPPRRTSGGFTQGFWQYLPTGFAPHR